MADRKIGDLWTASIIGLFFLSIFTIMFTQLDSLHGLTSGIGADLEGIKNDSSSDYQSLEQNLHSQTYNTSTFTVAENQFIDTRGTAQDFTIGKDSNNINQAFLTNAGNLIRQPIITGFLISMFLAVSIILILRFWKPQGI